MFNKIQKGHRPVATSEAPGTKGGYVPHTQHHQGVGRPPKPPFQPNPSPPSPHLKNQPTSPHKLAGVPVSCSPFPSLMLKVCGRVPIKPCLNFSFGLLSISVD